MKIDPRKNGSITGQAAAGFEVTSKMVAERAGALAVIKGRYARDVTESDLTQALRELMDEAAANP